MTLEGGLGEKHQLEFFVEYHDGLRQLLDFEPVAMLEKTKYWLEQFFESEFFDWNHFYWVQLNMSRYRNWTSNFSGAVKFIESVAGNEVNTDSFDTELFDKIIDCLDKMIKELEATNPKAAISGDPLTVWGLISGLMNLEKINLDERLQVKFSSSGS